MVARHAMVQHRPSHPAAFPGLYTVYKNSRSSVATCAQCYFVLVPNQLEKR
jgi:hypothetical protein